MLRDGTSKDGMLKDGRKMSPMHVTLFKSGCKSMLIWCGFVECQSEETTINAGLWGGPPLWKSQGYTRNQFEHAWSKFYLTPDGFRTPTQDDRIFQFFCVQLWTMPRWLKMLAYHPEHPNWYQRFTSLSKKRSIPDPFMCMRCPLREDHWTSQSATHLVEMKIFTSSQWILQYMYFLFKILLVNTI